MAEGESEQQHEKDVVDVIGGSRVLGNLRHGSLKNGFKEMAPAEVLLRSVVDLNGNLKRNVEQRGKATEEVVDEAGKDTELKGVVDTAGKQKGFSNKQVHDLKALLQALTLISRNLPLPSSLLGDVQSISYPPNVYGRQVVVNGDTQVFVLHSGLRNAEEIELGL